MAKQPNNHYQKELSYRHFAGQPFFQNRIHRDAIRASATSRASCRKSCPRASSRTTYCSDAHFYLLQTLNTQIHFKLYWVHDCGGRCGWIATHCGLKTMITPAASRILLPHEFQTAGGLHAESSVRCRRLPRSRQFGPTRTTAIARKTCLPLD
jgi:hypothetical protein